VPPPGDLALLLAWYDGFSADHWDFRRGQERNLAQMPDLTNAQTAAIMALAEEAGMVSARPPRRPSYDHCLILGGLVRACVTRPKYASNLLSEGVRFGTITARGGFRPLGGNEESLATELGVEGGNEFDAMDAGLRRAFRIEERPDVISGDGSRANDDWRVHRYLGGRYEVIAAPSTEPKSRRANSGDTFDWWAGRTPNLDGAHVLLITNPIYVPYQGAAATQSLAIPYNLDVETVGISVEAADLGESTQSFTAGNYLQETRSAIRGISALYRALDVPGAR
jgi:hypothetical protein